MWAQLGLGFRLFLSLFGLLRGVRTAPLLYLGYWASTVLGPVWCSSFAPIIGHVLVKTATSVIPVS